VPLPNPHDENTLTPPSGNVNVANNQNQTKDHSQSSNLKVQTAVMPLLFRKDQIVLLCLKRQRRTKQTDGVKGEGGTSSRTYLIDLQKETIMN
jgi:hypothetical protein